MPNWSYKAFRPFDTDPSRPVLVRLSPGPDRVEIEWAGRKPGTATLTGLKDQTDYKFCINDGKRGETRRFRTGAPPGTVVNYTHPDDPAHEFSGRYLGSPSLLRLPDGALLASMDYFHREGGQNLTQIFRSRDGGASWHYLTDLYPCFWGKLFLHRGGLYMLSVSAEYGDLLIGKSEDSGRTWPAPTVVARGGAVRFGPGFHRAPTSPILYAGRLWFSAEFGAWHRGYHASLTFSALDAADLLEPRSWVLSPPLRVGNHIIEGNLVTAPDGGLVNILRHDVNRAVLLRIDPAHPAAPQRYERTLDFPLGNVKFELLQRSGAYYAVGNPPPARNVLALYRSEDLLHWQHVKDILNYSNMDPQRVGFQYPSCLLEGSTLLILSRTAWNGAANHHDSNMMTFHRTEAF